jgi:8-oxo-dGTP diphosphatase
VPYQPILGTLAYIWDRATDQVLMVHRIGRADDEQLGKYNGLGGKLESHEDIVEGIRRELREEAEIEVTSLALRGTVNWPGFGPNGEDWLGFIFLVDAWTGTPPDRNVEGPLIWVDRSAVLTGEVPMWEGDAHFLPLVFNGDPRAFHGVMPYSGGRPESWSYSLIG